jgi:hypothetical protein
MMEALKGEVEKVASHEKEGVGVAVCGEKRKRRRKATKRLEKSGKSIRKEGGKKAFPPPLEKPYKVVARP